MEQERRKVIPPRRFEMIRDLTDEQRFELRRYELHGWQLKFVRHPMFDRPTPVLIDGDTGKIALLEPDGTLNYDHALALRDEAER